jgi:EAL domain-containing protein (putative c-di-GMP-specific phosphodiesterase class I)
VLREACRNAVAWPKPLKLAVNISTVQFNSRDLVETVKSALEESGLDPNRLQLEITESVLVEDHEVATRILHELKGLGVSIAMDDFGTGYSSLSNLRAFPFDRIKIDRSFIKSVHNNQQAATIVRAVLGLGKGLGLPVIAEGVETNEELRFLQEESCDEVQGYLLGKPAAIGSFRQYTHLDTSMPAAAPERRAARA